MTWGHIRLSGRYERYEQVRNCLIYDYGEDAIYVASTNVRVYNSTLYRTKGTGKGSRLGLRKAPLPKMSSPWATALISTPQGRLA